MASTSTIMQTPATHRSLLCAKDISVDSSDFKDDCESGMDGSEAGELNLSAAAGLVEKRVVVPMAMNQVKAVRF